jgi:hypothetical protein
MAETQRRSLPLGSPGSPGKPNDIISFQLLPPQGTRKGQCFPQASRINRLSPFLLVFHPSQMPGGRRACAALPRDPGSHGEMLSQSPISSPENELRKGESGRAYGFLPVIPATWETQVGRSRFKASPSIKISEALSQKQAGCGGWCL